MCFFSYVFVQNFVIIIARWRVREELACFQGTHGLGNTFSRNPIQQLYKKRQWSLVGKGLTSKFKELGTHWHFIPISQAWNSLPLHLLSPEFLGFLQVPVNSPPSGRSFFRSLISTFPLLILQCLFVLSPFRL